MSNPDRNRLSVQKKGLLAALLVVLLLVILWLSIQKRPPLAPVKVPPDQPEILEPALGWHYPENLYAIEVDDFSLPLDGSFLLKNPYAPGGLTKGYIENCMKLTPEVPFTVESHGNGIFRVVLENGQSIPQTLVELPPDPNTPYMPESFTAWIEPHLAMRVATEEGNDGAPIDRPFIIEFSMPMANLENPENFVSIDPPLPCSMEVKDNQIIVTPSEMMPYQASYMVTVSQNLTALSGAVFPADSQDDFTTENRDFSLVMTNQKIATVKPGSPVSLEYQLDTAGRGSRPGTVTLYAIKTKQGSAFDAYLEFLKHTPISSQDFSGKGQVSAPASETISEKALPQTMTQADFWQGDFPEGLSTVRFTPPEPGFYLVKTTLEDSKTKEPFDLYKPLQIASPSVYMQSSKGQAFFWVNDSATGEPLSGYTIRFLRGDFDSELGSAVTDAQGAAMLAMPKPRWQEEPGNGAETGKIRYTFTGAPGKTVSMTPEEALYRNRLPTVFVIYDKEGNPVYADRTTALTDQEKAENRYYSFLYLDRALYRPTDEIHFWGYLKPYAHNPNPAPQELTVCFDPDHADIAVQVKPDAEGIYEGVIPLEKAASGTYPVSVAFPSENGEEVLDTEWIEVNEFQKPAYTIAAETEMPLYRWGEEVSITITPTFFDGTPAPNLTLECSLFNPSTGNLDAVKTIQTDKKGKAVYRFHAGDCLNFEYPVSWTPKRAYYYIKIAREGENITYQGHYNYLPGEIALKTKVEIDDEEKARLIVTANRITLENIKSEQDVENLSNEYYYNDEEDPRYDILLGEPVSLETSADISVTYCRPWDGGYDPKYFDYTTEKRTLDLSIKDGQAIVENLAEMDRRAETSLYISAELSYKGPKCTVISQAYASNHYNRFSSTEESLPKGYSFHVYLDKEKEPAQKRDSFMLEDSVQVKAGQKMRFALCLDGRELPEPPGKILYMLLQDNIIQWEITKNNFRLEETPEFGQTVFLIAAYFDGKDVYPVNSCSINMETESVRLNIETKVGKESYLPGEQVTLNTKVTDIKGRPVSANLCISIVDEAVFALREQTFDLLTELYGQMWFYNYYTGKYTTLTGDIEPYGMGGDGGKGDGENLLAYDMYRKDFKDTAFFYTAQSDIWGRARVRFTLPDNLTSWRVTSLATGDLQGGQGRSQITVSLPFFIKPVVSSRYLAGDEISLLLKGYGDALEAGSQIDYTVALEGNGIHDTKTIQKQGHEMAEFSFGKLPEGDYKLVCTGKLGSRSDTMEVPFSVIHNNLELIVHQPFDPHEKPVFPASRYPVSLTFYNKDYQTYYDCLNALTLHLGSRLEDRMALNIAKKALTRSWRSDQIPAYLDISDDFSLYQGQDGGIRQYVNTDGWPGNDSDPILTAKSVLVAPDQFRLPDAERYLWNVSKNSVFSPGQQAAALAGLASMNREAAETILQRKNAEGTSLTEQLWYGIGLAWAGDKKNALDLYENQIAPLLDRRGGIVKLSGIGEPWEDDEASALAWAMAIKLGLEDAEGYAKYFSQKTWMAEGLFPCMAYIKNYAVSPAPLKFSYTAGGTNTPVDLGKTGSASVSLSKKELEDFALQDVPEGVAAIAYYVGEPEETDLKLTDQFAVSKTAKDIGDGKTENTITITLQDKASYGLYQVSDWVPSNFRLHSVKESDSGTPWINSRQEGQKLYFDFYHDSKDNGTVQIVYYTQRAYHTDAVQDSTYLICADTGEIARTPKR